MSRDVPPFPGCDFAAGVEVEVVDEMHISVYAPSSSLLEEAVEKISDILSTPDQVSFSFTLSLPPLSPFANMFPYISCRRS